MNSSVGSRTGLSSDEVTAARAQFGENRLPKEKGVSAWVILGRQFASPLVYIILAAAGISLLLREYGDFAVITAVVAIDVALGFVQEYRAHRTYVALKGLLKPVTTVIRNGVRTQVEVWELVPNDLVALTVGDKVPADGVLLEGTRLALDEAILTGESEPVAKSVVDGEDARLFMGSTVVTGRGLMQVESIGTATELGRIASSIADRVEEDTPLQLRLAQFSKVLTKIVVVAAIVILLVGQVMGRPFLDMLRIAIVLAIAAVPEGLIIAVTVILVSGMRRILQRRGLVKRLLAVETLGSVTVICTDKTGTLTEGRMRVTHTEFADAQLAWQTMVLCNNLEGPVDVALWEFSEQQIGKDPQALIDSSPRIAEELFTSETKFMIVSVADSAPNSAHRQFLKGAPEIVLDMCSVDSAQRAQIEQTIESWSASGLRLLGLAYRTDGSLDEYHDYQWAGLVGMEDAVRAGVPAAVATAQHAGIRVVMLTGDYRRTAQSVAESIGLPDAANVLEGTAVKSMSDEDLRKAVQTSSVFARIRPQDKLRIIRALEAEGAVTAMIGDGVNDAPALLEADIGVVVGSATDVAKETADLILLDNDFSTIVAAVEEGRVIFDNIRKVVAYVLSDSFAEVLTIFIAMLLNWPVPLLVAQILWIHLICDGPEDIVLGFEPKEAGVMDRPPHSLREPVLDKLGAALITTISATSALIGLAIFGYCYLQLTDVELGRSIVMATFAVSSVVYLFAYRSMSSPLWRMSPVTANPPLIWAVVGGLFMSVLPFVVPPLRTLLGITALSFPQWLLVFAIAGSLLLIVEVAKSMAVRKANIAH